MLSRANGDKNSIHRLRSTDGTKLFVLEIIPQPRKEEICESNGRVNFEGFL